MATGDHYHIDPFSFRMNSWFCGACNTWQTHDNPHSCPESLLIMDEHINALFKRKTRVIHRCPIDFEDGAGI
jgi:hypothetical protein